MKEKRRSTKHEKKNKKKEEKKSKSFIPKLQSQTKNT